MARVSNVAKLITALRARDPSLRAKQRVVRWPYLVAAKLADGGEGEVVVELIETAPFARGRGLATRALRALMQTAVATRICLIVSPMQSEVSEGALTSEQLAAWYRRLGFDFIGEYEDEMAYCG
jgi:ribosomal protein S18 acetylase RimI-like enzyme